MVALLRSICWNYGEAAASLVVFFLLTPFVLESLGTVGFGLWVLLNTILFYLKFLDLGFHSALVKYVAEHAARGEWAEARRLIGGTTGALLIAGIVALLASGLLAWLVLPAFFNIPADALSQLQLATVILGVDLLLAFPASVLAAILEGRQRFDVLSSTAIATMAMRGLLTFLVLHAGHGIVALAAIEIVFTLFTAALQWRGILRHAPETPWSLAAVSREFFTRVRGYSTWTSLNELLAEGGAQVEKLLIPIVLSVGLLTPYSLACAVAAVIFLAVEPITHTFFPLSSAYEARGDKVRLREVLLGGTKFVMGLSLPLAVIVSAYGAEFIGAWVGEEQVELPPGIMPLVATSYAVTAFIMTGTTMLLALARVREVFWMGIVELVLAVALVVATVGQYGLTGLAASLLVANVLVTFLWIVPCVCRQIDLPVSRLLAEAVLKPGLAAVPMAAVMLWIGAAGPQSSIVWVVAKGGACALVYVATFWLIAMNAGERARGIHAVRSMVAG